MSHQQSIEELQERYNDLNTRKIRAEANLKTAEKQLEQLQVQARDKYGTDDLDELKTLLEKMTSDNEEKRQNYQAALDQIEANLAKVDQDHLAAQGSTEDH